MTPVVDASAVQVSSVPGTPEPDQTADARIADLEATVAALLAIIEGT